MILRKNQDLFNLIKALAGVNQFTTNEVTNLVDLTNRRLTTAYDSSPMWTRYVVASEERDIISLNISGLGAGTSSDSSSVVNGNYILLGQDDGANGAVAGTNVYYNAAIGTSDTTVIYKRASTNRWEIEGTSNISINADGTISVQAGAGLAVTLLVEADSQKKDNPSEVDTWTLTTANLSGTPLIVDKQLIPYAQTGKNTIGSFIRIHRQKAFLKQSATEYDFFVDSDGANILNITSTTDNSAFVTYKKHIIDTSTGVIISSLDTDGSSGLQQIPLEFFQYTAHAVYADFLRLDGQHDKAAFEENKAGEFLAEELEKVDIINNKNSLNHKFTTHLNTSSR